MATNITTSFTDGTSSDAWQSLVNRRLLFRATYGHYAMMFTMNKPFPLRNGKTMLFRRYAALGLQTTALTEAVTPTPLAKSKTDVKIDIEAYGAWMEDSDFLAGSLPEGTLDNVDQLSQNMGETMDTLHYLDIWSDGTNVTYSNGAIETAVNTLAVYEDYNKALRNLRNNKARRFTPMIAPSQKVGTGSVMPSYWCLLSESMFYDIRAGSTFSSAFRLPSDYGTGGAIDGEGGALNVGIRLLPVPDSAMLSGEMIREGGGATGGDAAVIAEDTDVANVHYATIIGQEAAASVDLGIGNGGIIRHSVGSGGSTDPLDQRQTIGWKKYNGRGILNQAFFQTVKSAVSL